MPQMKPAVWVISSDAKYGASVGMHWPSYFTQAQQCRLERIRQATMLFDGQHRTYFLGEDRSQYEFPFVRLSSGRVSRMYITNNILALVSKKSADLLLGQEPLIRCSDEIQQGRIDALKDRTNLHTVLYSAAVECSYQAEAFVAAVAINGEVYAEQLPANEVFPVGPRLPDGQYAQYDRYQTANAGTDEVPIWLLLITHIKAGSITRECWQLMSDTGDTGNDKLYQRVDLKNWVPNPGLKDAEATGIAANTVTWIPNLIQRGMPVSDYDGVVDQQDTVNAKQTQVARVLQKHADPKLAAPESAGDENSNVRAGHDVFFFRTKDEIPQYITWSAELDAAMADRNFALNQLLVTTETSPVLLGLKEGAAPDAYKKVRLEAFNSLTKAQRKSLFWKAGIRRAVGVCLDLEAAQPGNRFDRSPIGVELRDGIPIDDGEQATTLSMLKSAGLISLEDAVEQRYNGDAAGAAKEIARIKEEVAAGAPSVMIGEPAVPETQDTNVTEVPASPAGVAA